MESSTWMNLHKKGCFMIDFVVKQYTHQYGWRDRYIGNSEQACQEFIEECTQLELNRNCIVEIVERHIDTNNPESVIERRIARREFY